MEKAVVLCEVQKSRNAKNRSHVFTCPIHDVGKLTAQALLGLVKQLLQNAVSLLGKLDVHQITLCIQKACDTICIGFFDGFGNGACVKGTSTYGRLGHRIEESRRKTSATEGTVAHHTVKHLGLYGK